MPNAAGLAGDAGRIRGITWAWQLKYTPNRPALSTARRPQNRGRHVLTLCLP